MDTQTAVSSFPNSARQKAGVPGHKGTLDRTWNGRDPGVRRSGDGSESWGGWPSPATRRSE